MGAGAALLAFGIVVAGEDAGSAGCVCAGGAGSFAEAEAKTADWEGLGRILSNGGADAVADGTTDGAGVG